MTLTVKIDRGDTSWGVSANDPSISGSVYAVGDTMDEALREFRSALEFHLEGLREDGLDVPSFEQLKFELAPASADKVAGFVIHPATVIPIIEEQIEVGKRQVQSGGVRINQTVEEVPVSEQVNLREEHVTIDRRPVAHAVAAGDTTFQDGVYEVTETDEVPAVAKTARVVEEVVTGKPAIGSTERATMKASQADSSVSNDSVTSDGKPFGK